MPWGLRRRLRELEARVAALETTPTVSHDMPSRPTIDSDPVDIAGLWRERVTDYATPTPDDVAEWWPQYL